MKTITTSTFKLLAILMAGLPVMPAWAMFGLETKLNASDADVGDSFGVSVAINGNRAIIGAHQDDAAGSDSGAAYLFDVSTGTQLFKLTASNAKMGGGFGRSVGISGNKAVVGAFVLNTLGGASNSAYLFDATTGKELFELAATGVVTDDNFGLSVAISGNTAIVGASGDENAGRDSGAAYLFDTSTGDELLKLTASDAAEDDLFGVSVAISGNMALVGATGDDNVGNNSGSAYLFDITTGNELFKLTASDMADSDGFGLSVAISGNTAIVGASGVGDRSAGAAYLFDVTTGGELFKLTASDTAASDFFGTAVAISGPTAIVGASGNDDAGPSSGSAYLFDTITGDELLKLTASDAARFDEFGISVAISGNTGLVGAYRDRVEGKAAAGSAYVFTPEPSSFLLAMVAGLIGLGNNRGHRRN